MYFSRSFQFLSVALLASCAVIVRDTLDPENIEASNPKTPPKTLNRPPQPANPFKDGFKTAPASCTDFMRLSEQCIKDLQAQPGGVNAFSGGELKWDSDHGCDETRQGIYQEAAWDAYSFAAFVNKAPDPDDAKDIAIWKTWIGADYPTQQKRIVGA
jgi:hypothetical protein